MLIELTSNNNLDSMPAIENIEIPLHSTRANAVNGSLIKDELNQAWLQRLDEAVALLDMEQVLNIIAESTDGEPDLVQKLTNWANHFQYEEISTFIQQQINGHRLGNQLKAGQSIN